MLMCLASYIIADSSMAPPKKVTVCSSGEYCAVSDPGKGEATLNRRGQVSPLWVVPGSYAWLLVADDGNRTIIGYPGLNLIPKDMRMDADIFRIYGPTGLVKSIALGDIYQSKAQLLETESHYECEKAVYLDALRHLVVEREDRQKKTFDPKTEISLGELKASGASTSGPSLPLRRRGPDDTY